MSCGLTSLKGDIYGFVFRGLHKGLYRARVIGEYIGGILGV